MQSLFVWHRSSSVVGCNWIQPKSGFKLRVWVVVSHQTSLFRLDLFARSRESFAEVPLTLFCLAGHLTIRERTGQVSPGLAQSDMGRSQVENSKVANPTMLGDELERLQLTIESLLAFVDE
jgi:hypothetical protein